MGKLTTILILFGFLASCKPCQVIEQSRSMVRDSIIVREHVRHDTVRTPADTTILVTTVRCDSVTNKAIADEGTRRNARSSVSYQIDDRGVLAITGTCDSLNQVIELKDREIEHLKETTTVKTKIVQIFKTHWYDMMCRWISGIAVLLIAAKLYFKTQL